jgi:hypothetical protein
MVATRGYGVLWGLVCFALSRAGAAETNDPPATGDPRPEIFLANVEGGITHIGLVTFVDRGLTRPGNTTMRRSGPLYGAGLGARVGLATFGVRARHGTSPAFDHWSLGVEAAFRPELGHFVPYAGLGVNYWHVEDVQTTVDLSREDLMLFEGKPIRGFGQRLFGGFDYRFAEVFSAGLALSGDLLFLYRETVAVGDMVEMGGRSVGGGVAATAVLGLHI